MTWLNGVEFISGIALLFVGFTGIVVMHRRNVQAPSALGLALLPVSLLVMFIVGTMLVMRGVSVI